MFRKTSISVLCGIVVVFVFKDMDNIIRIINITISVVILFSILMLICAFNPRMHNYIKPLVNLLMADLIIFGISLVWYVIKMNQ